MASTITNTGAQAIIQSAGSGFVTKIDITGFTLGAANTAPDPANTVVPGGIVYTGLAGQMKSYVVNANAVMYEITLPETVGGFSYGSVGLMTSGGVLFAYDSLPSVRLKTIRNLPTTNGDRHIHYMLLAFTNASSTLNITISPATPANLPIVNATTDLPAANVAPNTLYIVRSISAFGNRPGFAYTNGTIWQYTLLTNQAFSSYAQGNQTLTPVVNTGSDNSVALGGGQITGDNSFSFGPGHVQGDRSVNLSGNANMFGDYSLNFGNNNLVGTTTADYNNVAMGNGITVQKRNGFGFGVNNRADYDDAFLTGGEALSKFPYQRVHGGGKFSVQGDAQISDLIFRCVTTTTTNTEMRIANAVTFSIPNNNLIHIDGFVAAVNTVALTSYVWSVRGKVTNFGDTVSHTLVATYLDVPATTATVTFAIVGTQIQFLVKGHAAQTHRWIGHMKLIHLGF